MQSASTGTELREGTTCFLLGGTGRHQPKANQPISRTSNLRPEIPDLLTEQFAPLVVRGNIPTTDLKQLELVIYFQPPSSFGAQKKTSLADTIFMTMEDFPIVGTIFSSATTRTYY